MATQLVPDFFKTYNIPSVDSVTQQLVGVTPLYADAGALVYYGQYAVPNPDPTKPDSWAVDKTVIPKLFYAEGAKLGICDVNGVVNPALTSALNGSGGGGTSPVAVTGISDITSVGGATSVAVNGTLQISASVLPSNATNKTITWTSGTPSAATIGSSTGLVTGVAAAASVVFTATTQDGSFSKTFTLAITASSGAAVRKMVSSDLATGTGTDNQAYTQNKQILADGSSTVATTGSAGRARYNLKLAAGTAGRLGIKIPASGRSTRIMLRQSMNAPAGPSYQIYRGVRVTYGTQAQAVTWDGAAASSTDVGLGALTAGWWLWIGRGIVNGNPTIIYSTSPAFDTPDSGLTQLGTDTDPSNNGVLWAADAGDSGSGESDGLQMYSLNLTPASS